MAQRAKVETTRQHVKLLPTSTTTYLSDEEDYILHLQDDEPLLHDPDFPFDEEDELGDTSDFALVSGLYLADFFCITPAGYNSGGSCLERHIASSVLRCA